MSRIVVDKIDNKNGLAIIEFENFLIRLKLDELPSGIKEGSVLKLVIDKEAEENTRKTIQELENSLFID